MKRRVLSGQVTIRLGVLLLIGVLALTVYQIWRVNTLISRIGDNARWLGEQADVFSSPSLAPSSESDIRSRLAQLHSDLHDLRSAVGPFVPLAPLLSWAPTASDLDQTGPLLEYLEQATGTAVSALDIFSVLSSDVDKGNSSSLGQAWVDASIAHRPEIDRARSELQKARGMRELIDKSALSARSREYIDRIDRLMPFLSGALDGLALLPRLLGGDVPREYLLLIQNSDELRATGGFISSVVRVRVERGDIQGIEFTDSYAVDNPQANQPDAPAPLQRYMDANYWVFRDANWSPDFPTTARDVMRLYALDRGVQVDGVIASNLSLVPKLLEATGELPVEGYGETVDPENALQKLQAFWDSPEGKGQTGDWWEHRKDFAGRVFVSLLDRIRAGQVDRVKLLRVLADALYSRDLILFTQDPESQSMVSAAGWGGAVRAAQGDAWMLVDSNVGWNKVDPNVTRTASFQVQFDSSGRGHARTRVSYTNLSPSTGEMCVHRAYYPSRYAELQQGCYWNYVRLVAGDGAELTGGSLGEDGIAGEEINGRAVMGGYFVVPRGETRQIDLDYETPGLIEGSSLYRLQVARQPGAPPLALHIQITLPPGWTSARFDPAPTSITGGVVTFDLVLERDWNLVVRRQDTTSNWAMGAGLAGIALVCTGWIWLRKR